MSSNRSSPDRSDRSNSDQPLQIDEDQSQESHSDQKLSENSSVNEKLREEIQKSQSPSGNGDFGDPRSKSKSISPPRCDDEESGDVKRRKLDDRVSSEKRDSSREISTKNDEALENLDVALDPGIEIEIDNQNDQNRANDDESTKDEFCIVDEIDEDKDGDHADPDSEAMGLHNDSSAAPYADDGDNRLIIDDGTTIEKEGSKEDDDQAKLEFDNLIAIDQLLNGDEDEQESMAQPDDIEHRQENPMASTIADSSSLGGDVPEQKSTAKSDDIEQGHCQAIDGHQARTSMASDIADVSSLDETSPSVIQSPAVASTSIKDDGEPPRHPTGYRRMCVRLAMLTSFELRLARHPKFCKFMAAMPRVHLERIPEEVIEEIRRRDGEYDEDRQIGRMAMEIEDEEQPMEEVVSSGNVDTLLDEKTEKVKKKKKPKPNTDGRRERKSKLATSQAQSKAEPKFNDEAKNVTSTTVHDGTAINTDQSRIDTKPKKLLQDKKKKFKRLANPTDEPFLGIPGMPALNALWNFKIKKKIDSNEEKEEPKVKEEAPKAKSFLKPAKRVSTLSSLPVEYTSPLMKLEMEVEMAKRKKEEEEERMKRINARRFRRFVVPNRERTNEGITNAPIIKPPTSSTTTEDLQSNRRRGPLLGVKPQSPPPNEADDDPMDWGGDHDDSPGPVDRTKKPEQWKPRHPESSTKNREEQKRDRPMNNRSRSRDRQRSKSKDRIRREEDRNRGDPKRAYRDRRSPGGRRRSRSREDRRRSRSRSRNRSAHDRRRSRSREDLKRKRTKSRERSDRRRSRSRSRDRKRNRTKSPSRRSESRIRGDRRKGSKDDQPKGPRTPSPKSSLKKTSKTSIKPPSTSRQHSRMGDDRQETISASDSSVSGDGHVDTKSKNEACTSSKSEENQSLEQLGAGLMYLLGCAMDESQQQSTVPPPPPEPTPSTDNPLAGFFLSLLTGAGNESILGNSQPGTSSSSIVASSADQPQNIELLLETLRALPPEALEAALTGSSDLSSAVSQAPAPSTTQPASSSDPAAAAGPPEEVSPEHVAALRQMLEAVAEDNLAVNGEQRAKARALLPYMVEMETQVRVNPGSVSTDVLNHVMTFVLECFRVG